jgi:flagellin
MTVINTNVGALTARNYALKAGESTNKAMERLSSGLRINSAADDAAGLAVANKMESQLRGMNVAIRNSQDGISLVQTAEAGMSEISNMVIRMRELSVQMNNGIYTATDRTNAQLEITALLAEVDKISANTAFNDVKVLDGTYSADIRAGNTNAEVINVTVERMNTDSLGGINLAGTKTVATADSSTDANKVGTTSFSSTEAESVTIKVADFGVGISGFSAANANGTYSLSGTDAALFQLDSANNIVSRAAVAFDTSASPQNSYDLTVTYTDQIGVTSFAENLTLNITANQTLATVKSATSNLTTSESASVSFRATNSTGASDGILSSALQTFVSADTGSGTYSVSGTDAAQFTVDQNNGVITASLDFETKQDSGTNNVYDFDLVYTSSTGDKFTETVALTVTDSQEETVTFGSTVANTGFSAGTADVTVGDVFSVAVDGQTLNATITADDAAFTITKLANILNSENAQQATPARGTFSVSSGDIVWTFNDSVGNIDDSLRPGAITQVDKTVKAASVTTTAAAQTTTLKVGAGVAGGATVANDVITLTVGGSTLTYTAGTGDAATAIVSAFTAQDTTDLAFTLTSANAGADLVVTMKDNGAITASPTLVTSGAAGFNTAMATATTGTVVTDAGRSDGREAVAKVTTYGGLGASLNAAVSTDTFDVTIGGTNISATVGAGVTSGTYGIASLVTDLNAANQALATPVAITFSANGGDLVATAVNANDDIAMTSAVQRNNGDVGSVTLTTRAAAAVSRTVDFAAPGVAAAISDRIEVTVNGTTYSTANNLGGTAITDVVNELNAATTVDADGNQLNALYTASVVGSDIRLTAVSAGTGANVDTFADLTYVLTGTVAISGGASTA